MLERSRSVIRAVELDADSWRASAAIPVLGIIALFAAAPLGAWGAVVSGLVATAAFLAFIRQQQVDLEHRILAEGLAESADADLEDEPARRRRVADLCAGVADRLSLDIAQQREIAIAIALRSAGRAGLSHPHGVDPAGRHAALRASDVARAVTGWEGIAGAVAGQPTDSRSADVATIVDVVDRFDELRRQGLGSVAALNLLGADGTEAERRVLEVLNDLAVVSPVV